MCPCMMCVCKGQGTVSSAALTAKVPCMCAALFTGETAPAAGDTCISSGQAKWRCWHGAALRSVLVHIMSGHTFAHACATPVVAEVCFKQVMMLCPLATTAAATYEHCSAVGYVVVFAFIKLPLHHISAFCFVSCCRLWAQSRVTMLAVVWACLHCACLVQRCGFCNARCAEYWEARACFVSLLAVRYYSPTLATAPG